ncbi:MULTISPECIES: hypothetical protein [unclassified Meridianimarinicoccus]|uniref:hypothetical protein n=1 Tax=unclassified Meridianimarinicoccus TaxID=2923344 RepID=UPI001865E324|nr:hypothetical protein [Fluviibacterium sp. MJW13]
MFQDLTLSPMLAVGLVVVMALSGQAFRSNWKLQADGWVLRAWLFALPALLAFSALAFLPMRGVGP